MIIPVGANNSRSFKADTVNIDKKTGDYKDPLMRWPIRGLAFSNEVGESLRPIIGNYATLTWIPVLMYIGADIYDKYKNDQTEYSPDSKRCLKQAIFQGLASMLLPIIAVHTGQDIFSQFGRLSENKISFNDELFISKNAQQFIANGKMRAFDGKDEECVNEFLSQVKSNIDFKNRKKYFFGFIRQAKNNKIKNYASKTIKDLIQLRKDLLNPSLEIKSSKNYVNYVNALKNGQTENVAVKTALSKFQNSKMNKGKFVKTIGGFTAFGCLVNPIDHFVEHFLIGKYVEPGLEKLKSNKN